MATSLNLPEGFELDTAPESDSALPDGFVLDSDTSSLPDGFELDTNKSELPDGFQLDKEEATPEEPNFFAKVGRYETENLSAAADNIKGATEPFKPDAPTDGFFKRAVSRVGQYVGGPLFGAMGAAVSPITSSVQGATEEVAHRTYDALAPEGAGPMTPEEAERTHNVAGAVGGAVADVGMAIGGGGHPKVKAKIDELNTPKLTPDQELTRTQMQDQGIDVSGLGPAPKEAPVAATFDDLPTNQRDAMQRVITGDEDAKHDALDAGVPPERLEEHGITDVPEAYKEASTEAKQFGIAAETDPSVAQQLAAGAVKYTDDGSVPPSLVPKEGEAQLGAKAIEDILNSKTAKVRSRWIDDLNMLNLMDRAAFRLNEKDIGRRDMAEKGDLTPIRNLSQRGAEMMHSLIGDASGTNNYVLKAMGKASVLERDTNILPLNTAIKVAKNGGMSDADISQFLRARDAYDDYANVDRLLKENGDAIQDKHREINSLASELTKEGADSKAINKKIAELKQEISSRESANRELINKESHMTQAEANDVLLKYKDNTVAQVFGENINKLHGHLLDMLVDSGKLTAESAANIRRAHPNYLPAWRDVDDFTFGSIRYQNTGGSPKAVRSRDISNKALGDTYNNMVLNIVNTTRKVEQAKFRGQILQDFLLPKLDDAGFQVIFRESKADVLKAMDMLKAGKREAMSASDVTPTEKGKVQNVGNIVFDVDGRRLQLTIKDKELFKELSQARIYDEMGPIMRGLVAWSRIRRNLITSWNLGFSARAFQRDSMDFMVGAKATPFKDYIPVLSNFKHIFTKEFNPELYNAVADNLGFGSTVARDFYGKNAEQIAAISKKKLNGETSLNPIKPVLRGLENISNRIDIAPRILQYKIAMKNLMAEGMPEAQAKEQAIRLAKELGVNYSQKGTSTGLDHYIKSVTFARTFMNSTDRLVSYARYEPAKLARNTFLAIYLPYKSLMVYNSQFTDEQGVPFVEKLDPNIKKDVMPIYGPWSKDENDYIPWRLGWVFGRAAPAIDKTVSYAMQQLGSNMDTAMAKEADQIVNADNEIAKSIKKTGITGREVYSAWTDYTFGLVQPSSALPAGVGDIANVAVTNKDAFGRNIVPSDLADKPAFNQYRPGETSQALVDFSYYLQQKTGTTFSPMQAEYLANSMFSSAGAISVTAGNFIYGAATGREVPRIENKEIPFFNAFSGKGTEIKKDGTSSKFYNIDQYLRPIQEQYDALVENVKTNPAHAPDLERFQQDNAVELYYADKYKDALSTIADYRDAISQIASADKNTLQGNQTPETELLGDPIKRKKIDELKLKIQEVQKSVLDDIRESPLDTDDIWYERLTRTPATKVLEKPLDFLPSKNKEDKTSFLDNFSLISDAEASEIKVPKGKLGKAVTEFKESKDGPALQKAAKQFKIPMEDMMTLANIESTVNSKTDKGYLQMTDIAVKQAKQYLGDKGKNLTTKTPEGYAQLATAYAAWTREQVQKTLGSKSPPTLAEWYPAYNAGVGGWKMLKNASPSAKSVDIVPKEVYNNNKHFYFDDNGKPLTVSQTLAKYSSFVNRKMAEFNTAPAAKPKPQMVAQLSDGEPDGIPSNAKLSFLP